MTSENPISGATGSTRYVIGVDVGTGSARAGIFDLAGRMVAAAKHDITLFHASASIVEQSSGEIWNAVCHVVKDALSQAAVSPDRVAGIGFDATCTVTCKWTYLAHERRWDESFFRAVGLGVLADEAFARIGQSVVDPGTPLGSGLTANAAAELGLRTGTPVATGVIDAHAGGIGT